MEHYEEDTIDEVHRIRAELVNDYGGIKGYIKHAREEEHRLKREGWEFIPAKTMASRQTKTTNF